MYICLNSNIIRLCVQTQYSSSISLRLATGFNHGNGIFPPWINAEHFMKTYISWNCHAHIKSLYLLLAFPFFSRSTIPHRSISLVYLPKCGIIRFKHVIFKELTTRIRIYFNQGKANKIKSQMASICNGIGSFCYTKEINVSFHLQCNGHS